MTKRMNGMGVRVAMAAFCVMLLGVVPMRAQDQTDGPPPPRDGRGPGGAGMGGERRLEMLTKRLNLTPEQATQIKAIEDDSQKQMLALRDDTSTPREQKRDKMMSIRTAGTAKTRALLTDAQKTKFDEMEARMRERGPGRRGPGGQGQDGPPPPPPGV